MGFRATIAKSLGEQGGFGLWETPLSFALSKRSEKKIFVVQKSPHDFATEWVNYQARADRISNGWWFHEPNVRQQGR